MDLSRLVTGVVLIFGSFLLSDLFYKNDFVWWIYLIYSLPLFLIGLWILFDFGNEKGIEAVKTKNIKTLKKRR